MEPLPQPCDQILAVSIPVNRSSRLFRTCVCDRGVRLGEITADSRFFNKAVDPRRNINSIRDMLSMRTTVGCSPPAQAFGAKAKKRHPALSSPAQMTFARASVGSSLGFQVPAVGNHGLASWLGGPCLI